MQRVANGIFSWDGVERRSRRYGFFVLDAVDYGQSATAAVSADEAWLHEHAGERVRLVATIVEARDSGHAGDAFLGIEPSRPAVGEQIEIGVGTLRLASTTWSPLRLQIGLEPSEARDELWLDPRVLYRLHDQTVEISGEVTLDAEPAAPDLSFAPQGMVSNGDGSAQASGSGYVDGARIYPSVRSLGDGAFTVEPQVDPGKGGRLETAPLEDR
jgi:hypothetical protein